MNVIKTVINKRLIIAFHW